MDVNISNCWTTGNSKKNLFVMMSLLFIHFVLIFKDLSDSVSFEKFYTAITIINWSFYATRFKKLLPVQTKKGVQANDFFCQDQGKHVWENLYGKILKGASKKFLHTYYVEWSLIYVIGVAMHLKEMLF